MPFEIAPQVEAPTKISEFQDVAAAILRGCVGTRQARAGEGGGNGETVLCVIMAHEKGGGAFDPMSRACAAYKAKYGRSVIFESDYGLLTREQIAARIAAL